MAEESINVKEVFKAKVKERLNMHPNQWTGEDSVAVVLGILTTLKDDQGNPILLTPGEKDVINLASRPTNEVQVRVIKRIIEHHNAKFDTDTEDRIRRVVSPTAFKMELIKAGFIKDTGEGGLKDLL